MEPQLPATTEMRERNARMATQISENPAQPYKEGTYALRVVEMRGRRSGQAIAVPLAVFQWHGNHYLTTPTRERPWARNLLAAGECVLIAGGVRTPARATLAPDDEAVPVLREYTAQLGWTASQFPFPVGATDDVIRAAAPATAVFRLDLAAPPSPEATGQD